MKRVWYVLIASLLVLVIAGCQSEDPTPAATAVDAAPTEAAAEEAAPEEVAPAQTDTGVAAQAVNQADIVDIVWQWTNFQDTAGENDILVPVPSAYTIIFRPDGTANINSDCNVVIGSYTLDNGALSIVLGPSTLAFCGDESLDQTFNAFLSQAATVVFDGSGNLVINLFADAGNMVFANAGAAPPVEAAAPAGELTETVWQWTEFQDTAGENDIAVTDPARYTVIFRPDGAVNIQADCNVVLGTYTESDGASLTITLGPTTAAFCGDDSLDTVFLSRLDAVATYVFDASGNLVMNLFADAGNMVFANGGAAPPVTEAPAPTGIFCTIIEPANVIINTLGLPYSWQSNCVPEKPYDQSQPPGPMGYPEHVQVNFGTLNYQDRQPSDPVVFIMPTQAYREMWDANGNTSVSDSLDRLAEIIAAESDDLPADTPVLPVEMAVGARDIFVQGQYLELGEWSGVRFVARYGQGPNPVTNENLYYIFQGLAGVNNDIFISFFYPVTTSYLPQTAADVSQEEMDQLNADVTAYLAERNGFLDSLGAQEWSPNLNTLDAVIGSLEYTGDLPPQILPPVELPEPDPADPYGLVIAPIGVNVRTGPGQAFTVLGTAPFGAEGEIIGISPDGLWWVTPVSSAPNGQGWVSAAYVQAFNVDNVPVIQPPALPTPTPVPTAQPTPTAVPVAVPVINFWADRTSLNQGECTHLRWDVQNVQAVWVYPQGSNFQNFPVTGSGARLECPATTTTYELRAQLTNGNIELRQVTITVNPGNTLANTNWTLDTLNGQALLPGTTISAFFGNGGNISGFGGCNSYNGTYFVDGTNIAIRGIAGSLVICEGGASDQETTYFTLLQAAARFELTGNQLILFGADGTQLMRFLRA